MPGAIEWHENWHVDTRWGAVIDVPGSSYWLVPSEVDFLWVVGMMYTVYHYSCPAMWGLDASDTKFRSSVCSDKSAQRAPIIFDGSIGSVRPDTPFITYGLTLISAWISNLICSKTEGWNYLSIPTLQRLHRWCLGIDKLFYPTLQNICNYSSMLGLKLIHASKRGPGVDQLFKIPGLKYMS